MGNKNLQCCCVRSQKLTHPGVPGSSPKLKTEFNYHSEMHLEHRISKTELEDGADIEHQGASDVQTNSQQEINLTKELSKQGKEAPVSAN